MYMYMHFDLTDGEDVNVNEFPLSLPSCTVASEFSLIEPDLPQSKVINCNSNFYTILFTKEGGGNQGV